MTTEKIKEIYIKMGIDANATSELVKKSFVNMVKSYHPNLQKVKLTEKQYKELNQLEERLMEKINKSLRLTTYKIGLEKMSLVKEVKFRLHYIFKKAKLGEIDLKLLNLLNQLTFLEPEKDLEVLCTIDPDIRVTILDEEKEKKM